MNEIKYENNSLLTIAVIIAVLFLGFYFFIVPWVNKRADEIIAVPLEDVYPDSQVIPERTPERTPESDCAKMSNCKGFNK